MALTKCTECAKDISDQATTCPHCGYAHRPVLIERTGKSWKLAKLISWLVFISGIFTLPQNTALGMGLASWGFIGIIITKIGIWWRYH